MSFSDVALKITKDSIVNAIYIDDDIWLPFEERNGQKDHSDLYRSFSQNACSINFNRFSSDQHASYKDLLALKDLLILDWHLLKEESDLSSTFEILNLAINTSSLHFCVIYTKQDIEVLSENIVLNIASYYSGLCKPNCKKVRDEFNKYIDATGLDEQKQKEIVNKLSEFGKVLFLHSNDQEKTNQIVPDLKLLIDEIGGNRLFNPFLSTLGLPEKTYLKQIICLGFILSDLEVPESSNRQSIKILNNKLSIQINNLYIKVFSKNIGDDNLYAEFTQALTTESNIFLTILGLEIRNRFRETSGFIGRDLKNVSHLAFFHHRNSHFKNDDNSVNPELFNEFLKDVWKDQVASFLYEKEIKLFDVIDEYIEKNDINSQLENFSVKNTADRDAISSLNWVYNRLAITRKKKDEIRFGDIFYFKIEDVAHYLLCLTPVCSCLRPGKIKNLFFFVEGSEIGIPNGVKKGDGDFISYVKKLDDRLTCVDWASNPERDCKPFTLYIKNNRFSGDPQSITFSYQDKMCDALYICTLKNNYAQRIANRAFFYPMRVGIDFASFKTND